MSCKNKNMPLSNQPQGSKLCRVGLVVTVSASHPVGREFASRFLGLYLIEYPKDNFSTIFLVNAKMPNTYMYDQTILWCITSIQLQYMYQGNK